MSSRKYILEISVLIILALLLYGCVREEEASEEPVEKIEYPKSERVGTSLGELFKNIKL